MTTTTDRPTRPYLLFTNNLTGVRTDAPTVAQAIRQVQEQTGRVVDAGYSLDGGNVPFDAADDIDAWMRAHRTGDLQRSAPLPSEYAAIVGLRGNEGEA